MSAAPGFDATFKIPLYCAYDEPHASFTRRKIMSLAVGTVAPDFELKNQFGEMVTLSQFKGVKPVVLVFFPLAFSGICTGELCELRDNLQAFEAEGIELMGISVDSHFALRAWGEQEKYTFSLLADFWPHGGVARDYGVFVEDAGIANRGTFVIDREGKIVESIVTAPGQAREFQAYLDAIAKVA
jgi:peroxiredoxin